MSEKRPENAQEEHTLRVRTLGLRDPEADVAGVLKGLADRFKVSEARAKAIVKGRVVASDLGGKKARALKAELLRLGVVAKVEKPDAQDVDPGPAPVDLGGFLAGVGGRYSGHVERDARYKTMSAVMFCGAIALPLLYLATVVGLAVGLWFYATGVPIKVSFGGILLWVTPLVVGGLLITVLVRPLFLPRGKNTRIEVDASHAPQLFKLVAKITTATGTPQPEKIYVDANVNAYVSSAAGSSGFLKKKLELTVGLPLLYGLNTLQVASVLAHEFGHFSQSFDMFTSSLVNRVNSWLGMCGWYQDPLEEKFARMCDDPAMHWLQFPLMVALQVLRGVRFCFRHLYVFNTKITRSLSRQMEYNADDHAVQVIGSEAFASTSIRFRELVAGEQQAWSANFAAYNENRLFTNMPAAVVERANALDEQARTAIRMGMEEETTDFHSTHPADKDRNDRALRHGVSNVAGGEVPAIGLVKDIDKLAAMATVQMYQRDRGFGDAERCLVENAEIFELDKKQGDNAEALANYLGDAYDGRMLTWATDRRLLHANSLGERPPLPAAPATRLETYYNAKAKADNIFVSTVYSRCGVVLDAGTWDISDHGLAALEEAAKAADAGLAEARASVDQIDAAIQALVEHSLAHTSGDARLRAGDLHDWLGEVEGVRGHLAQLEINAMTMSSLLSTLAEHEDEALQASCGDFAASTIELVNELVLLAAKIKNPLATASGPTAAVASVAAFFETWGVVALEPQSAPSHVEEVANNARGATLFLYRRVLGEVAELCLNAERTAQPTRSEVA